jgi:hypothetical protein
MKIARIIRDQFSGMLYFLSMKERWTLQLGDSPIVATAVFLFSKDYSIDGLGLRP